MPAIDLSRVPQSAFLFQHLPPGHPAHSRFIDMRQAVNIPAPALANLFAAPPTIQPTKMTPSIKPENPCLPMPRPVLSSSTKAQRPQPTWQSHRQALTPCLKTRKPAPKGLPKPPGCNAMLIKNPFTPPRFTAAHYKAGRHHRRTQGTRHHRRNQRGKRPGQSRYSHTSSSERHGRGH